MTADHLPVRIGILGTARIARAVAGCRRKHAVIAGIASRDPDKADRFGGEFGIPGRYGTYEALIGDTGIDAVYIPLPQHLHCKYTVLAARAGKHVLVEKPAALSAEEVDLMIRTCREHGVVLMEAFMYRFMAIHKRARELASDGTIGALRYVDFNFCFHIVHRGRTGFRMERQSGGGALYDLGVYGMDFLRFISREEPLHVHSFMRKEEPDGIDWYTHAVYRLGGAVATMTCAFNADANYYVLAGERGSVTSPVAISGRTLPNVLRIHLLEGDRKYNEHFPAENPYEMELDHFADCIINGKEPCISTEESLRNIRLIEQVQKLSLPL